MLALTMIHMIFGLLPGYYTHGQADSTGTLIFASTESPIYVSLLEEVWESPPLNPQYVGYSGYMEFKLDGACGQYHIAPSMNYVVPEDGIVRVVLDYIQANDFTVSLVLWEPDGSNETGMYWRIIR